MKPNCLETTAFSGRIFQKSSNSPFLPERMMAPQGQGVLLCPGEGTANALAFPSPGFGTCPRKPSFLAKS